MLNVLLVRHAAHDELGRVLSGRSDLPLNAAGTEQAFRLAKHLQLEPIDLVATSPCLRARQTAAAIAREQGGELVIEDALNEIDFGDWTGRSFTMLGSDPLWHDWNERRSTARPPAGESMREAVHRTVDYIECRKEDENVRSIVCVSHGDIIRGTIAHYLGLDLNNIHRFDVAPASISKLEIAHDDARLVLLNQLVA
ncbi:histidine phosphatase family protein [Sphingobium bisphenolivorans]|uniref:histidine phosphatase family protein n=1 Tax=Sphingobium bisphenolivorans TaxID=1335760 RepID=UPI0004834D94|nr:histidine phosphatase family protein [Sphingobium bisphenolivorans]